MKIKRRDPFCPDTPEQTKEYLEKSGVKELRSNHSTAHILRMIKYVKKDFPEFTLEGF